MAGRKPSLVKITIGESEEVEVAWDVIRVSKTIVALIEDLGRDNKEIKREDAMISLKNVDSLTFQRVLIWCKYHKDDLQLPDDGTKEKKEPTALELCSWDKDFFNTVGKSELLDLILAANHLQIDALLDAACKAQAERLRGMSVEQIRKTYGLKNDFSPEEEDLIRRENEWCNA